MKEVDVKTYTLSESAMKRIGTAIEMIHFMLDSDQEYTIEAVNAQFDKIEDIMAKDYSSEVIDSVTQALQKAVEIPFPNFDISKYQIDLNHDQIKRGDGTLITKSNATTVEQTLLESYNSIVEESNDVDADMHETLDALRAQVFGM
jgi:hypothetical protein